MDVKEANDAPMSENLSTATPTKSQFNANAVEFVPGQFKGPNPAAPVFTPQFQLTPSGYVPINPYAVPYYMYVPTDGTVMVSPVLTYQTTGGFSHARASSMPYVSVPGKGGLARNNSTGSRPPRGERKEGSFSKPFRKDEAKQSKEEAVKQPEVAVVMRPEDFPSMLPVSRELPAEEDSGKPSWAAIARKPNKVEGVVEEKKQVVVEVEEKQIEELEEKQIEEAEEKESEAAEEEIKCKLAPWAPKETISVEIKATNEEGFDVQESVLDEQESESCARLQVYSLETLRRLRFHESCRPTADSRGAIPAGLLRQRKAGFEESDDWRAEMGKNKRFGRVEISAEMLIPSENSWSVAQQKKDAEVDENLKVGRKIFAVLNKLTMEKFGKLSEQLFTECGIAKPAHIISLVKFLFEKATVQHHFISMYADLCAKCLAWLGSDSAPEELVNSIGPGERSSAAADIFRRVLLERCQAAFYSFFLVRDEQSERSEEEHHKHRLSMLGTVKFVAQLLDRRLMTRAVFRNCLETLLDPEIRTDDHIECACVFLTEIGKLFEKEPGSPEGDAYSKVLEEAMDELQEISADPNTIARIKFAILNLVDLRANQYVATKSVSAGPAKIADLHKQAAKEELLTRSVSKVSHAPTDEWETVPKKHNTSSIPSGLPRTPSANAWKPKRQEKEHEEGSSSSD